MGELKVHWHYSPAHKNTFLVKPIGELVGRYISKEKFWIDPFANESIYNHMCRYTNDLNPSMPTTHHLNALDFLKTFEKDSIDGILFDPPYSPSQIKTCYEGIGVPIHHKETTGSYWKWIKDEISRIIKPNGICISCCWNTNGMGRARGFKRIEIAIIAHGGIRHDTLVVVERKMQSELNLN